MSISKFGIGCNFASAKFLTFDHEIKVPTQSRGRICLNFHVRKAITDFFFQFACNITLYKECILYVKVFEKGVISKVILQKKNSINIGPQVRSFKYTEC